MSYSREEQETSMIFETSTGKWSVYTNIPKHIRKLTKLTDVLAIESNPDGTPISIKCELDEKMVSMKKIRQMTEEQKQEAAVRLQKAREAGKL